MFLSPVGGYYGKTGKERNGMLSKDQRLKYEIAEELGLLEKLKEVGWAGLSAAESGRIGGLIAARKKKEDETDSYFES